MLKIEDLEKIHSIGNELHEVKVEFHRDVKINVAGTKIEGKHAEILNIPRWIAELLESDGHVEIQEPDMVVELKQSTVKENVQGEFDLSTLDSDFYIKLKSYMKRLPERDFDKVQSMLNSLLRKRQGKLIRLADSSKLSAELAQKLSVEEREFYNQIHQISDDFVKKIMRENK